MVNGRHCRNCYGCDSQNQNVETIAKAIAERNSRSLRGTQRGAKRSKLCVWTAVARGGAIHVTLCRRGRSYHGEFNRPDRLSGRTLEEQRYSHAAAVTTFLR